MFGLLSIFGKDVLERDRFDLLASDDGQEPRLRAMVETTRASLFLVKNTIKMNKPCEDRPSESPRSCLPTPVPTAGGAGRHRARLPGNLNMITGSAFLPAPAYRQEGGASSRLARDRTEVT